MNLLWALGWWWRLEVAWWGWAWLLQGAAAAAAAVREESWTEATGRVCLRLYKARVAMLSSRFLPFISSLFKPSENIQCTCATPPPAVSLEVGGYVHTGVYSHTQRHAHTHTHSHTQRHAHTHTHTHSHTHTTAAWPQEVKHFSVREDKFFKIRPKSWLVTRTFILNYNFLTFT